MIGRAAARCLPALALAGLLAQPAPAQVPEPEGYRGPPYNAPVPETLRGAEAIGTAEAMRLHAQGVPFLDVYPRTVRPAGLPEGTLWREPVHRSIPGAIWVPGAGHERLTEEEEARYAAALAAATGGDRTRPVVVFCRADCWMGWNAAKRAVGMGYSAVRWFPDGSDGWEVMAGDLAPIAPPAERGTGR